MTRYLKHLDCPTCGRLAGVVDWSQNAECHYCGARWNERDRQDGIAADLRRDYEQRTGKRPLNERKKQYL